MIKPRNVQISKESKVKDLKDKIFRCVRSYIHTQGEEEKNQDNSANFKISLFLYSFGLKENKKETFELIYAYKNKLKSHRLAVEHILDEEVLMEVSININI